MVEANHSLQQSPTIRITTAAHVLAQLRARQHVKRQLQALGHKVSHYSARDISVLANQYLGEHRDELMPPAVEQAQRWMLQGVFGKRAQKEFIKHLGIEQSQGERSVANGQS